MFQYCSPFEGPFVCTDEFVMYSVTVLDPTGEPADSVQIEVSNKETGNIYDVCEGNLCNEIHTGTYTIMHDGFFGDISKSGEKILVEGTKEDLQFKEEYAFRSGDCHIEKLAGPDTVSLASK